MDKRKFKVTNIIIRIIIMNDNGNDSNNSNDFIIENEVSSISKTQKKRSIAWNHFTIVNGKAKCNYCTK